MKPYRFNIIKPFLLIGLMLITKSIWTQKRVGLHAIKFTENPEVLLKGITYIKSAEEKAVLATYNQPAKKLTTNGNVRAWYRQTPTLFIQLMTTYVGFHDKRGQQVACTLRIVTLKALKSGAEPRLLEVYKLLSTYKV